MRPEDPCKRSSDTLTPNHVGELAAELRRNATRVARTIAQRAALSGAELVTLADLAGFALWALESVALDLDPTGGAPSAEVAS